MNSSMSGSVNARVGATEVDTQTSIAEGPTIYTRIPRLPQAVIAGLANCGVSTVVEALGPIAGPQQWMGYGMVRRTTRSTVAGQAITAVCGLADNLMMHAALQTAGRGDVLVVACGRSIGAQWGELVSTAAQAQGLTAAVVDGAVRDVDAIETIDFPVWATMVCPLGATKDTLGWVNRPLTCAGVHVEPGDVVVADGDGVVVVPFADAHAVLAKANARREREAEIRIAAKGGQLPGEQTGTYAHLESRGIKRIEGTWNE